MDNSGIAGAGFLMRLLRSISDVVVNLSIGIVFTSFGLGFSKLWNYFEGKPTSIKAHEVAIWSVGGVFMFLLKQFVLRNKIEQHK